MDGQTTYKTCPKCGGKMHFVAVSGEGFDSKWVCEKCGNELLVQIVTQEEPK